METFAYQVAIGLNKTHPKKPASFLFYGNSGVGKSEAAKALPKILSKLTGREYAEVLTDLNTFTEAHSVYRLTGAPPSYAGYDDPAVLENVSKNPNTVFIFDELDKAHPEVLKIFMAILDEGRCAARRESADGTRELDFKNSILIFTSNHRLGSSPSKKKIGFTASDDVQDVRVNDNAVEVSYTAEHPEVEAGQVELTKRIYRETEAARKAFVETGVLREIASRFGCFVGFKELSAEAKVRILVKQILETGAEYNLRLTYIASPILQALVDASTSENALTVRSFKTVIEGYLAAAFAEAGTRYGGQAVRLEGTIEVPVLSPA